MINIAVPLFLAISGYFFASKKTDNKKVSYLGTLFKQIKRVYIPYVVWSCIFILFMFLISGHFSLKSSLYKLLSFQTSVTYYYVALIIQLYIIGPLLLKYHLKAVFIISCIISLALAIYFNYYTYNSGHSLPLIVYAGNALTWLMFFVLGIIIQRSQFKINTRLLLIGAFIFLLLSILETYGWMEVGVSVQYAASAVKFSSFLYSACIIMLLLQFKRNWKLFSRLGQYSYGIYLMHLIILTIISKIIILNSFIGDLLLGIITLFISYGICFIANSLDKNIAKKYLGI